MFGRFSNARTSLSIAYDIQPLLTSHWSESIDAFAVNSSDTEQSTAQTNRNATNAERTMNTIEIVRMLLREERNKSTTINLLSLSPSRSTVFDCSSNNGSSCSCRHGGSQNGSRTSDRPHRSICNHHPCAHGRNMALSRSSSKSNYATRGEVRCSSLATSCITMID
jgi:hypothetical protein